MRHDEITSMITGSSPEDWYQIYEGPYFLDQLDAVAGHGLEVRSHDHLAVYKADADLRLAWGLPVGEDFEVSDWHFADRSVRRLLADALWRGSLVARWTVLLVDGGRCYLPEPQRDLSEAGGANDDAPIRRTAPESEIALARLLWKLRPQLTDSREFDSCMSQAGITEVVGS